MELKDRIIDKINETICEKNETPFPKKNLLIELTNYCNNKCVFIVGRGLALAVYQLPHRCDRRQEQAPALRCVSINVFFADSLIP